MYVCVYVNVCVCVWVWVWVTYRFYCVGGGVGACACVRLRACTIVRAYVCAIRSMGLGTSARAYACLCSVPCNGLRVSDDHSHSVFRLSIIGFHPRRVSARNRATEYDPLAGYSEPGRIPASLSFPIRCRLAHGSVWPQGGSKTCRLDQSGKIREAKILPKSYWLRAHFCDCYPDCHRLTSV